MQSISYSRVGSQEPLIYFVLETKFGLFDLLQMIASLHTFEDFYFLKSFPKSLKNPHML